MKLRHLQSLTCGLLVLLFHGLASAADPSPETLTTVQAKIAELRWLSTDSQVVAAVRKYNAHPSDAAKAMTNEKWTELTVLDPLVRSLTKNPLMAYLRSKKDPVVSELFVSGADGGKVGFLRKTTSWSHKGKAKHEMPMKGQDWIGPVEVDASTGVQQIQVSLPVLDGAQPIGSVVVGLAVAKLK
jgi:hypothetical protein